jgi:tetratricopeptide (TPR) repeat protein
MSPVRPSYQSRWLLPLLGCGLVVFGGCNFAARLQNIRGRQAFETGNYNEAALRFQRALQRNPYDSNALYNLGATQHALAKLTRNGPLLTTAEQYYRQSIAIDPRYSDAHRGLAVLLAETGRTDAAFDLVRTWSQRNPHSAEPLVELARLHQEFGDRAQATQLLTDALARDSQNARALTALAHNRELDGQYQLALQDYYRAYQLNSRQPGVAAKIAQLQSQLQVQPIQATPPARWGAANPYVPR